WPGTVLCFMAIRSAQAQVPTSTQPEPTPAQQEYRVRVDGFRFRAADTNRPLAFSTNVLAGLVAGYVSRELGDAELEAARETITKYYLKNGYINSGAVLPDQDLSGGIVTLVIVEGRLSQVYVHGAKRLKPKFIQRRIQAEVGQPLRLENLADA